LSVLRVRYAKLGRSRWIGHLDLARCFERAVRRARIAARYSEGFSSHLRLAFGPALPVGAESVAEYLDVELAAESPPAPEVGKSEKKKKKIDVEKGNMYILEMIVRNGEKKS
jgi:radical SAM-linked protein